MKKTVVELDLIGYSTICDLLEEMAGVEAVTNLNKEIQAFVDAGLERIRAERAKVVMQTTGDGAILVLEQPADAHRFAEAVHEATHKHNERKNKPVGKRVFRIGAATGDLAMEQKEDGRYEMAGMTIARAVRLERKASPGGVLVDSDTHEGLTEQQKQLYQGPEQIAGKRDEMFSAYQCIMCPDAAKNVEYFVEQAKQKPDAKPIKPATLGVERERREILNRFELLKPHHFSSLVFLMNIPVNRRPPDTVDLERQKKHILDWADQDGRLGELLLELRGLQTDETTNP
jgi:class 3 adenylate cyclase